MLSIDGIETCEHVHKRAKMAKLLEVPSLRRLVPFVRSTYGRPTSYTWIASNGQPENSKRAHQRVPALQTHHQNSTRREKKNEYRSKGKKREIFGSPPLGEQPFRAPPFVPKAVFSVPWRLFYPNTSLGVYSVSVQVFRCLFQVFGKNCFVFCAPPPRQKNVSLRVAGVDLPECPEQRQGKHKGVWVFGCVGVC